MDEQNEVKHPEAVNLGLPSGTKWASFNIGATKPEECGGYFAWGETEEKEYYNKEYYNDVTYKYSTGDDTDDDCWYDENEECQYLGESICGTEYDVARVRWGADWQMPTMEQIKELFDNCKSEWTEVNGVKGRKFTGPNGNSIFLPAAGHRYNSDFYLLSLTGFYWSGTRVPDDDCAYSLRFYSGQACWGYNCRYYGFSVRPVSK